MIWKDAELDMETYNLTTNSK